MLAQVLGLLLGAGICTAVGYGGWLLAREGQSLFGIAAIIAALGTPASVFVYWQRRQTVDPPARDTD